MALRDKDSGVYYTKWNHVENGNVITRRIHRLEIQGRDGRLYIITGAELPDYIQTCAGVGHKGLHIAQILLPEEATRPTYSLALQPNPWFSKRDLVCVMIGLALVLILKGGITLAATMLQSRRAHWGMSHRPPVRLL